MLIGNYSSVLSLKRRCAVPRKFLDYLGRDFIVAKWYEGCLILVNKKTWNALLNKLTGKAQIITEPVRDTDRFILGSAYEVTADLQGRVVIPSNLAEYANLKNKLVFLGLGDRVEIWDEDIWRKKEEVISKNASYYIERFANEKR